MASFAWLSRLTGRERGRSLFQTRLSAIEERLGRLERFGQGAWAVYVGNNRVLTKAVVGDHQIAFYVEADDRLLTPWFVVTGSYETDLTDFFVRELKPNSHCIDVGANFGYFTCLMSRLCPKGRVIGIEVDKHVYELARDNLFINSLHGVGSVIRAAASDADAPVTLHRRSTRSGNTSIGAVSEKFTTAMGEAPAQAFTVGGLRIDRLLPQFDGRVDFMKVDVEGAEPLVFRGARETIAANPRLKIVMEWSPGQIRHAGFDIKDFLDELAAMGLAASDMQGGRLTPLAFGDLINLDYRAGIVLRRA